MPTKTITLHFVLESENEAHMPDEFNLAMAINESLSDEWFTINHDGDYRIKEIGFRS